MTVGCIIQARMGSSRLPGKVIMEIDNKPILEFLFDQLSYVKNLDKLILATTSLPEDNILVNLAIKNRWLFFRGSPQNVLERFYFCTKKFELDTIIRITADNPLIDPSIIENVLNIFQNNNYDYVSNCQTRTFPFGTEVEIFSKGSLEKCFSNAKKSSELEHVTPYIYNNPNLFKIYNHKNIQNLSSLRWTVDRINDYNLVKTITEKITKRPIFMSDILQLFKLEPNLVLLNKDYVLDK